MPELQHLGWRGAADIAALTTLAFVAYMWLRGTVGVRVLGGLAALLTASIAVSRLGLVITSHLLQAVTAGGVLLVAIVFRDEIRRALLRADPTAWVRRQLRSSPRSLPHHDLASALARLASKRIGALVVVPRTDDVAPHITGGHEVGARISGEVLEALFHTRSPLHDGAAILDDGTLRTAGALLPLDDALDVPAALGTRHRAAIGLSRACDALVLVVSEERGTISLVLDGELTTGSPQPYALAEQITELAGDSRRPGLLDSFHNRGPWWRTVMAGLVILAAVTGVRMTLVGDQPIVRSFDAPIELRHVADGTKVELLQPRSGTARVRASGPRWLLDSERAAGLRVWADVRAVEARRPEVALRVEAPSGIDVVDLSPQKIKLDVKAAD